MKYLVSCLLLFFSISCKKEQTTENFLAVALTSKDPRIKNVVDSIAKYKVQLQYVKINRIGDSIQFKTFNFQVDSSVYFYPASTVKLPTAVAALEKLNAIDTLTLDTKFYVEGDTTVTTFSSCIRDIFAVSDNAANNRLVEFLGFDDLNHRLKRTGIGPVRISHRLSTDQADQLHSQPLLIYQNDSTVSPTPKLLSTAPTPLSLKEIEKGIGYVEDNEIIMEPFDFSLKNHFPIQSQTALLKRIFFPEVFPKKERFNLTTNQLNFLREAMAVLPHQQGYDRSMYYDSYVKFFMYGDQKEAIPKHIKIYNKVGYAYGTLTDTAYIVDSKNDIEFILSGTILVNQDGIFNNDNYEYDSIGIPFLAQLGRVIYAQYLPE
ncbi:serine hydrolase [Flavobacterium sp. ASW18X]|uniref:serine hydrolase n=1 Tax=Flavobacterium sp. ASW18X TaxID=2572595 RepID=UPI0010AE1619|nr:serine hydrolase [Flavobacterium sp. ASW18X]TKD58947.1 serine hydrolase [Flavobacterium sp. ASW18X]